MAEESPVTHNELATALQPLVTRAELEQFIKSLAPSMQLAVVNGVKEAMPAIMEKIDDQYKGRVSNMHNTLYDDEKGLVIVVDRIVQMTKELPGLIKMKWQLYGLIFASNILCILAGIAVGHFSR
jgi:hypothetical protein